MKKILALFAICLVPLAGEATNFYVSPYARYERPAPPQPRKQFNLLRTHSHSWSAMRDRILTAHLRKIPGYIDPPVSKILPGLYLGAESSEGSISALGITRILCVKKITDKSKALGVRFKIIPIKDSKKTDLSPYLEDGIRFIDEADGPILVHCARGHSRSATFVIAYLMRKFNVSFDAAYRYVQECRPSIRPNPGFVMQLRKNEERLRKGLKIHRIKPLLPEKH